MYLFTPSQTRQQRRTDTAFHISELHVFEIRGLLPKKIVSMFCFRFFLMDGESVMKLISGLWLETFLSELNLKGGFHRHKP